MLSVKIHDFRVVDRVLGETEPDAGDVVFLGSAGSTAHPFIVVRTISGPGGVYIDAVDVVDADGRSLGIYEKQFELNGESKPRTVVSEIRGLSFPRPGTYTLQYMVYDDVVGNFPFSVVQQDAPGAGIVAGPLDAALSKSTIAWLTFGESKEPNPLTSGHSVKTPLYKNGEQLPIWYGYEEGRVYVLSGPEEQQVPLEAGSSVRLVARSKDKRSRVAEAECSVEKLAKDAEWERVARDLLVGRRLNLRDGEGAVNRWKETCEIYVLSPLPPRAESAAG